MKADDEIMAEYLLKGGKMLSKTCPECGAPLFEVKGETKCVVCAEKRARNIVDASVDRAEAEVSKQESVKEVPETNTVCVSENLVHELEKTVILLCRRVQEEKRSDDCLILMECIQKGVDSLNSL
ncbi:MAG: Sjogren's syndrome/scleroderma autoantigen 1 family protein [Euryarchaeota archaeon]|nr:Sjogren's syndrome/scleroderma autoantigen 1 family protein [Euryarchaeota archaeon]